MKYDLPNNRTLEINQEESPQSPREWDNLTQMIFFGKYKHLGDNHNISVSDNYNSRQDFIEGGAEEVAKQLKDVVAIKPVHVYQHGGTSISTSMGHPFNCRWDSGTCGFVLITKADIRRVFGVKRVTKKLIAKAEGQIDGEVKTLDQYINGEIHYFNIETEEGATEECVGGFYGSDILTNGMKDYLSKEDIEYIFSKEEIEYAD